MPALKLFSKPVRAGFQVNKACSGCRYWEVYDVSMILLSFQSKTVAGLVPYLFFSILYTSEIVKRHLATVNILSHYTLNI